MYLTCPCPPTKRLDSPHPQIPRSGESSISPPSSNKPPPSPSCRPSPFLFSGRVKLLAQTRGTLSEITWAKLAVRRHTRGTHLLFFIVLPHTSRSHHGISSCWTDRAHTPPERDPRKKKKKKEERNLAVTHPSRAILRLPLTGRARLYLSVDSSGGAISPLHLLFGVFFNIFLILNVYISSYLHCTSATFARPPSFLFRRTWHHNEPPLWATPP